MSHLELSLHKYIHPFFQKKIYLLRLPNINAWDPIKCSIHHSHLLGNSRYVVVECCCGEQVDVVKLVCLRYRTGLLTFSCTCCPQKQPRVFGTMFWRPKERVMSRKTPVQPMVEFFEIHQSPKLGSLWQSYESNDGFWII